MYCLQILEINNKVCMFLWRKTTLCSVLTLVIFITPAVRNHLSRQLVTCSVKTMTTYRFFINCKRLGRDNIVPHLHYIFPMSHSTMFLLI